MKKRNIGVFLIAIGYGALMVKLTQINERRKHQKELKKISNELKTIAEEANEKINKKSES